MVPLDTSFYVRGITVSHNRFLALIVALDIGLPTIMLGTAVTLENRFFPLLEIGC